MNYSTHGINGKFFFRVPIIKCRNNVRKRKSSLGKNDSNNC